MTRRALDETARALEHGELVGIFPEGRITDTGQMCPFRAGIRAFHLAAMLPEGLFTSWQLRFLSGWQGRFHAVVMSSVREKRWIAALSDDEIHAGLANCTKNGLNIECMMPICQCTPARAGCPGSEDWSWRE